MPPNGVGGGGVHWNAETWRFLPSDFELQHASDRALRREIPARRHDDPGLGRHLRRARALLRPVRISLRHLGQGRQHQGRRSRPAAIRSRARARATIRRRRRSSPTARRCSPRRRARWAISPFPQPSGNLSQAYTNPLGVTLGPVHLLRLLRMVRLRQLLEGQPADDDPAGADAAAEFRGAHRYARCCRSISTTPGKRATGVTYVDSSGEDVEQPAELVLLCAFQLFNVHLLLLSGIGKPYDPRHRRGRDRPQLLLSGHVERRCLFRRQDLQSVRRVGRDRHVHRRFQRRQFRSRAGRLRRRRLYGRGADQRPADRRHARRRRARRTGAPHGRRRSAENYLSSYQRGDAWQLLQLSRRAISISIRPTPTGSAAS